MRAVYVRLKTHMFPYAFCIVSVSGPDVTSNLIEEFCERGVSMVVFNFNGVTHDQCRRMVNEIRHGVYNYSLNKNMWVPYSLALALEIGGPRIVTGTVNPKVSVTRVSLSNILSTLLDYTF